MSAERQLRKIDSIQQRLSSPRFVQGAADLVQARIEERILDCTAKSEDFAVYVAPNLRSYIDRLEAEALLRARGEKGRPFERLHGVPWENAAAIVAPHPRQGDTSDSYDRLEHIAAHTPIPQQGEPAWWRDRRMDSDWAQANIALVVLGDDRGASLRTRFAPAVEQAWAARFADQERVDREIEELLTSKLEAGTARWAHFYVWFEPQFEQNRAKVFAAAVARRHARLEGHPTPLVSFFDHAAEYLSYTRDEVPPPDVKTTLQAACDLMAPLGSPGHEDWIEANRWRRAMGGGWGDRLRDTIHSSPPS